MRQFKNLIVKYSTFLFPILLTLAFVYPLHSVAQEIKVKHDEFENKWWFRFKGEAALIVENRNPVKTIFFFSPLIKINNGEEEFSLLIKCKKNYPIFSYQRYRDKEKKVYFLLDKQRLVKQVKVIFWNDPPWYKIPLTKKEFIQIINAKKVRFKMKHLIFSLYKKSKVKMNEVFSRYSSEIIK